MSSFAFMDRKELGESSGMTLGEVSPMLKSNFDIKKVKKQEEKNDTEN